MASDAFCDRRPAPKANPWRKLRHIVINHPEDTTADPLILTSAYRTL